MSYQDNEQTLPSVAQQLQQGSAPEDLFLTVIFHPDMRRIGQVARVPRKAGLAPWVLGRRSPNFSGCGLSPAPLDEAHISRQAVELDFTGAQLTLNRFAGSSRCRCGDEEVFNSATIGQERLRAGVPIVLSHSVVLMLRLSSSQEALHIAAGVDESATAQIIGRSAAVAGLRREITEVAASDFDVLVRGETGSGKELVARAIHAASRRHAGPLVSVNMAAIPEELAAAALFGSARGAFTGADRANSGYFRQAEGGSLLLDEIGDTPASLQPLLLRALQQREVQAVGGAIVPVDVRVISATDADLESPARGFKSALHHRLAMAEINVPPLREHPEDIGELCRYFLQRSAPGLGRQAVLPSPTTDARHIAVWANLFYLFSRYHWPGNVRQLENFMRQLLLDSARAPQLNQRLLAILTADGKSSRKKHTAVRSRQMRDIGDTEFEAAMDAQRFEVQAVAQQLGVSRTSVYRRIESSARYRLATQIPAAELRNALRAAQGDVDAVAQRLRVSATSLRRHARHLRDSGDLGDAPQR
ncbi:MAG: hypothetical protein Hals2KO_38260 [Halioglobus sp.]